MTPGFDQLDSEHSRVKDVMSRKESPAELQQKFNENRDALINGVNSGKEDLANAMNRLKSDEARGYIDSQISSISGYLANVADKGLSIIRQNADEKEVSGADLQSIDSLSGSIRSELNEQKREFENYKIIQSAKESYEESIQKDSDFEGGSDAKNIDSVIGHNKSLAEQMTFLASRLDLNMTSGEGENLRSNLQSQINSAKTDFEEKKNTFERTKRNIEAGREKIKTEGEKVSNLGKLVGEYENKPSEVLLAQIRSIRESLNLTALGDEIFGSDMHIAEGEAVSYFYQQLWELEYSGVKTQLDSVDARLDAQESKNVSDEAKLALEVVKKTWADLVQPAITAYESSDRGTEEYSKIEDDLLGKLLQTKGVLSKFTVREEGAFGTIEPEIDTELKAKYSEVQAYISKIETNREVNLIDESAVKKGLGKYVRFPSREGEGSFNEQNYDFTPEFYKLPESEQLLIRMQVEEIAVKQKEYVKGQTAEMALKFANPEEKMKILSEMLGEKGAKYFEGVNLLKASKPDESLVAFQSYIALSKSFTPEENNQHKDILADAKEKIAFMLNEKLNVLDDLFSDVKQLSYATNKLGGNPELTPEEGLEADAISAEISAFREEIARGQVTDFSERFAKLKESVRAKIAEKKSKETEILKKLEELHDIANEKDPEKRKEGFAKFAKEARNSQAYNLAKKYLDYALEEDFKEASKKLSKSEVLANMLKEPDFVRQLNDKAEAQYALMMKENPALKGQLTLERVKDQLLDRALDQRYRKELRRFISPPKGMDISDPVLRDYNNWFPLDEPEWYKPWDYGAKEWDDFQMECVKFVWEQVPSLGVGFAASAAGRVGARFGGRLAMKYLVRQGLAEAEIGLIQKGGIEALKASLRSGKALSYGASRLVGASVLEGTTMYGLGLGMEYLQTGKLKDFEKSPGKAVAKGLAQSMALSSIYRSLGLVQESKLLASAMAKGGMAARASWVGRESLSGAGGMLVEYAMAKAEGRDYTGKEAFQSFISNYLTAMGMGIHGRMTADAPVSLEPAGKESGGGKVGGEPETPMPRVSEFEGADTVVSVRRPGAPDIAYDKTMPSMRPDEIRSARPAHSEMGPVEAKGTVEASLKKPPPEKFPETSTPEGMKLLEEKKVQGVMTEVERAVYEKNLKDISTVESLLSNKGSDGAGKTPEQFNADLMNLKQMIDSNQIELNPLVNKYLSATPEGISILRGGLRSGKIHSFDSLAPDVKEKIRDDTANRLNEVAKQIAQEEMHITEVHLALVQNAISIAEHSGKPVPEDFLRRKSSLEAHMQEIKRWLKEEQNAVKEKFRNLEGVKNPEGFEGLPSISDLLYANVDTMNMDYINALTEGHARFQHLETTDGQKPVMYLMGRKLGEGGLGEVWSTAVFEEGSLSPHEMVVKKPLISFDITREVEGMDRLSKEDSAKIDRILSESPDQSLFEKYEMIKDIINKSGENISRDDMNNFFARMIKAHEEIDNVKRIMKFQNYGELDYFTEYHFVDRENGLIFMESIANPELNYQVADLHQILTGKVTTLDGINPVTPQQFWGYFADALEALDDFHRKGLIHRDIKPANIGIVVNEPIRLLDAGSIKTVEEIKELIFERHEIHIEDKNSPDGVRTEVIMHPQGGGITPKYYSYHHARRETDGTLGPDGKRLVPVGASDTVAMGLSIEDIINGREYNPKSPGDYYKNAKYFVDADNLNDFVEIANYLTSDNADGVVGAQRIREIMNIP